MTFKKDKEARGSKLLRTKDSFGDELILNWYGDTKRLYVCVNEGCAVQLSRSKALKLAYAIINELDPIID
jgi:hypothetical protein